MRLGEYINPWSTAQKDARLHFSRLSCSSQIEVILGTALAAIFTLGIGAPAAFKILTDYRWSKHNKTSILTNILQETINKQDDPQPPKIETANVKLPDSNSQIISPSKPKHFFEGLAKKELSLVDFANEIIAHSKEKKEKIADIIFSDNNLSTEEKIACSALALIASDSFKVDPEDQKLRFHEKLFDLEKNNTNIQWGAVWEIYAKHAPKDEHKSALIQFLLYFPGGIPLFSGNVLQEEEIQVLERVFEKKIQLANVLLPKMRLFTSPKNFSSEPRFLPTISFQYMRVYSSLAKSKRLSEVFRQIEDPEIRIFVLYRILQEMRASGRELDVLLPFVRCLENCQSNGKKEDLFLESLETLLNYVIEIQSDCIKRKEIDQDNIKIYKLVANIILNSNIQATNKYRLMNRALQFGLTKLNQIENNESVILIPRKEEWPNKLPKHLKIEILKHAMEQKLKEYLQNIDNMQNQK